MCIAGYIKNHMKTHFASEPETNQAISANLGVTERSISPLPRTPVGSTELLSPSQPTVPEQAEFSTEMLDAVALLLLAELRQSGLVS